jgi:hypothetical protein
MALAKDILVAGLAIGACYALFNAIPEPPQRQRRVARTLRGLGPSRNHTVSQQSWKEIIDDLRAVGQQDPKAFANLSNQLLEAVHRAADVAHRSADAKLQSRLDQMQRKLRAAQKELAGR